MRRKGWIGGMVVLGLLLWGGWHLGRRPDLVLYCAHDSVYADAVVQAFEAASGLRVAVRYDTEATKSLGLTELLLREQQRPRCDLFWNNELLGTLDLAERGILAPYRGTGYARIPAAWRDPAGRWTGFGARLRVYIVNTNRCEATAAVLEERLATGDLSRVAMARPLYGTTLTHYCVLWREWGEAGLRAWHRSLRERGLRELTGNSTVKNQVAAGGCDFGFTDSDDFFLAQDAGAPVRWLPVLLSGGQTVVIPNTAGVIAGCRHPEAAGRFLDFLLSAETELALANSASRQIPLGLVDETRLSADVKALRRAAVRGCPLTGLGEIRSACMAWLKQE